MRKQKGWIDDWTAVLLVFFVVVVISAVVATAQKQAEDRARFMGGCLQDKKQYECDVLWNQTAESKQNRDLAIGIAAGAAIGAAAGRK